MSTSTLAHRTREAEPGPAGILRSLVASGLAGGACTALGLASHQGLTSTPTVEGLVAASVTAVGAVAAAALALGSLLLLVTAVSRAAGRSSTRLDAWTRHLTPVALRRAVAVTVTAGILATGPSVATASELDLGWTVTATTDAGSQSATGPHDVDVSIDEATSMLAPSEPMASTPTPGEQMAEPWHVEAQPAGPGRPTDGDVDGPGRPAGDEATDMSTAPRPAATASTDTLPPGESVASGTPLPAEPGAEAPSAQRQQSEQSPTGTSTSTGAEGELAARPDAAPKGGASTVEVRPGDSLWSIAATLLPADASDAEVAATWPTIYAENRPLIGPDADLIHPGQVLTVTAAAEEGA